MGYKLLGMVVWKGGKLFLHRRYGATYAPKPLLAGVLVAMIGALAFALIKRES